MKKPFIFGTKAETLNFLFEHRDEIDAEVLEPVYFTVREWNTNRENIINKVWKVLPERVSYIVRSSAKNEDTDQESMAGKYTSLLTVRNKDSFVKAVSEVIISYGEARCDDQVLVQEAVNNVQSAGVVFTYDPNSGGRYYVINYDDSTGSTSSVTSGNGKETKLFYWFVGSDYPKDRYICKLCKTIQNLEKILYTDTLDIEFLFSDDILYILQVRPLNLRTPKRDIGSHLASLNRIEKKIRYENISKPFLFGSRTIYGVMPDWNPAEMIGIHPRNLSTSLYKEIITDDVWAYQRDNYGYKKLRSFPLMVDFCGFPYIDVRVSFNSFIPADLDSDVAEKLVNYYLDRLEESPEKHDKVEFDIVFSCYTFDLEKRIQILREYGFTSNEIKKIINSLRDLTKRITDAKVGLWKKDAAKLDVLSRRKDIIESSTLNETGKAFWLLEDCKRYGTLPFAGLARAGFIAVQLLRSMVFEGIISQEEKEAFMNDLETVSSSMKIDYTNCSKEDFLKKYGFLRPGTYDICSKRYDEAANTYFSWKKAENFENGKKENFKLSLSQMERIRNTMIEHQMGDDVLGLFAFIKGAIEGREQAKFIFTRNVSEILRHLGKWGEENGFSREEISYIDIQIVKDAYSGTSNEKELLKRSIISGRKKYNEGNGIVMPPLILSEKDVKSFYIPDSQPTYVTNSKISGESYVLGEMENKNLDGKILVIESADPGYDWIFSHNIKGFITKYGGANSHMAIRAGELQLTAAIGVGQKLYDLVASAEIVEIDPSLKQIKVLR